MANRTSRLARTRSARFPVLLLALTLLASLTGCGLLGDDSDDGGDGGDANGVKGQVEKSKIRVGVLPVVDVGPFYLALENGYFKDEGLDVEPVVLPSGPASINGVLSGDLDIGFASYPAPIVAQSKGVGDFKIVAEALAAKPGHLTMVAPPNSTFKKAQDAPGKKIAITARNSFTDLAPMAVLESQNVDFSTIQWVEMGFPEMIPAMERGDVDGAVLVEPWRTIAEQKIGATVVIDGASGPTGEIPMAGFTALAGEGKLATTSPNTIAAFQRALAKAADEAQDRAKVEPILVKYAKVDKAIAPLMTIATYSTSLDPKRIQRVADLLQHFNVIDKKIDVADMILRPGDEGK